jgi:hypothetical protein
MVAKNIFARYIATSEFVHVDDAPKHGKYKCSDEDCGESVFVKRAYAMGTQKGQNNKTAHFAHHSKIVGSRCPRGNGGETLEHYHAKHHIAKNIADYIFVKHDCIKCGQRSTHDISNCIAHVERGVPGSRRIADVLLCRVNQSPCIVEVLHTHAVDDTKHSEMQSLDVPVIEVTTELVQSAMNYVDHTGPKKYGPIKYVVKTTDYILGTCRACRDAKIKRIAQKGQLQQWQHDVDTIQKIEYEWDLAYTKHVFNVHGRLFQRYGIQKAVALEASTCRKRKAHRHDPDLYIGKCKSCNASMFDDAVPIARNVSMGDYCALEWEELCKDDPVNYRVKYYEGRNTIKLCSRCVIQCVGCNNWMALSKARQYGACITCYGSFGLGDYVAAEQLKLMEIATKKRLELEQETRERMAIATKKRLELEQETLERMAITTEERLKLEQETRECLAIATEKRMKFEQATRERMAMNIAKLAAVAYERKEKEVQLARETYRLARIATEIERTRIATEERDQREKERIACITAKRDLQYRYEVWELEYKMLIYLEKVSDIAYRKYRGVQDGKFLTNLGVKRARDIVDDEEYQRTKESVDVTWVGSKCMHCRTRIRPNFKTVSSSGYTETKWIKMNHGIPNKRPYYNPAFKERVHSNGTMCFHCAIPCSNCKENMSTSKALTHGVCTPCRRFFGFNDTPDE